MASYYNKYLKKYEKEEEEILKEWNQKNPDKKLDSDFFDNYGVDTDDGPSVSTTRSTKKTSNRNTVKRRTSSGRDRSSTSAKARAGRRTGASTASIRESEEKDNYIAPVNYTQKKTKTAEPDERTTFTKGLLDDGYDRGDILLSFLSSASDFGEKAGKGFFNVLESGADNIALGVERAARRLDNEDLAEKARTFQDRDLFGESTGKVRSVASELLMPGMSDSERNRLNALMNEADIDQYSLLGDRADSFAQSAGQWGAQAMLQSAGIPWQLTTASTSLDSAVKEARERGEADEDGLKQGVIDAFAEIVTSKFIGGSGVVGGKGIVDPIKEKLTQKIASRTAKAFAKYGIDFVGEGMEEVASQFISNAGKKITYEDDKTFAELVASDEAIDGYIESFVSGGLLSGLINAKKVVKSAKTGRDYDTGLSKDEEAVIEEKVKNRTGERQKEIAVDEEVNRRIANRDKGINLTATEKRNIRKTVMNELETGELELDYGNTKISKKEAAEIREQITEDLKKGYIDMTDIEDMFAGEEFKNLADLKSKLSKDITDAEKAEIEAKMDEIKGAAEGRINALLKKSPYFAESYRQKLLKGESFTRDEQESDTKITKELTESAKAAGMNNTGRMHDLFEYTNKIANDTDTKYGFINSKQLKEMGYSMKDATINGMVRLQEDGTTKVLINVDSDKALNTIIGHETTHLFEGTKEHAELVEAVKEYAAMKGEYDSRFKATEELYKNVDANIENEVTADLVGDYIFTDEQFIQELTKKPNVFQKVYDYIKHAYKMATAGSSEARQLLKAKRAFEKAYQKMPKESTAHTTQNTKYSLRTFEDGKRFVEIDGDTTAFDGLSPREQGALATKIIKEKYAGKVIGIDNKVFVNGRGAGEYGFPVKKLGTEEHDAKMRASTELDNLVDAGYNFRNEPDGKDGHVHPDVIDGFDYFDTIFKIGDKYFEGTINIKNVGKGKLFKDITKIKDVTEDISSSYGENPKSTFLRTSSINIISQNNTKSNENSENNEVSTFSLSAPVEETKELIAVHNMRSSELMKTLDLGGLPMPSIAIIKAKSGHAEYGDVSLVFNKETIDPKFMRANKVYGGDAWTPTYPTIEYKANQKVADKIHSLYYELAREHGYDDVRPLYNYAQDLEDTLNRNKGEAGIMERLADDTGMMQVYLLATGNGKVENIEKEIVAELSEAEIEMNDYFINALGEDLVKGFKTPDGMSPMSFRKTWFEEHGQEVENVYANFMKDIYQFTDEEVENVLTGTKRMDYSRMLVDARNYLAKGPRTVRTEVDSSATAEKIRETAGEGYAQWLKDLFSGAEEKTGIRNNVDPFTRSGNRRSWEALHWENNLENVVKVMKQEENGVGFFGGSGIFGVSAKEYGSIDEIRADSSRLERMGQEEYEEIKESLGQRFQEIATSIMDTTERNQFIAIDNAMECIVDAVRNSKTKSGIMNVLKQYKRLNVTETTADDIVDLVKDIAAMPTEYFEAKPRRAVGLDEIAAVIIPDNADAALLSRLEEGGYNVITYKAGDETDRAAKLNEQQDVLFSLSNDNDIAPVDGYAVYGKDVKLNGDIAPIGEGVVTKYDTVTEDIAPLPERSKMETFDDVAPVRPARNITPLSDEEVAAFEAEAIPNAVDEEETTQAKTRKELRNALIEDDKDFIRKALENARPGGRMFRLLLNNTDTIRANEITFGREAGSKINELIFQKEIDNEAKSIAWQNKERADIRNLGIHAKDFLGRPTKESAAVQKYGEGQYVNQYGDIMKYGDEELEAEFKDGVTQEKIKHAARVIRAKYDTYIDTANDVLTGLGFDPIPKRNDYMRHFQELNDAFSRFGIPFSPQEMQEHTLPTDINGLTEFWSPQKNYFANAQPRLGIRTEYDAITGIDGYISGIANLIFHTEDIQRGRAFESLIRETYGQDQTIEDLREENLTDEEIADRIEKIQAHHLSKYAAWLHEWTNNIAGKKSKTDRAIEETADREPFAVLDGLRRQVGANMIGFNISSSLTNLIAPAQAIAKTNKIAVLKGATDTVRNLFHKDEFVEKNSFLTSRFGTDMLSKTPFQKMQDAGYVFMKGVDYFSSNLIVRSKYAELRAKGMSEEKAHTEAGKFAARLMGDRTKGANAQLYNSKLFNVIGQFQLEVNNQLYSMFYDTYYDSKENAEGSSAKMAAGVTFTLGQLFVYNHLFGKVFESVAGYNPTFDVIGIMMTALGVGDDDDEEKTTEERLQNAADQLVDALPYVNILTGGGRIPIASAIPNVVGVMTGGKDDYGNELTWEDELKKLLYLAPPTGGNQIKKTYQGLKMFNKDLPLPGSYTDSGNLRFPVEPTAQNIAQAFLFGQWANENAREYFDGEHQPLKEKQIQEFKELELPIADYWKIREDMAGFEKTEAQSTTDQKLEYIDKLKLPISKKNTLANNILDDREEPVDMAKYNAFKTLEEFDFAVKNPGRYTAAKAIGGYDVYDGHMKKLGEIKADKDGDGNTISGSAKEKMINYLAETGLEYGEQVLLLKCKNPKYKMDDEMHYALIEYLGGRTDISYEDKVSMLTELGYTVNRYEVGW